MIQYSFLSPEYASARTSVAVKFKFQTTIFVNVGGLIFRSSSSEIQIKKIDELFKLWSSYDKFHKLTNPSKHKCIEILLGSIFMCSFQLTGTVRHIPLQKLFNNVLVHSCQKKKKNNKKTSEWFLKQKCFRYICAIFHATVASLQQLFPNVQTL